MSVMPSRNAIRFLIAPPRLHPRAADAGRPCSDLARAPIERRFETRVCIARSPRDGVGTVRRYRSAVDSDLEPVPEPHAEDVPAFDDEALPVRRAWWRWVAVVVVIALVVATPFAFALYRLLG